MNNRDYKKFAPNSFYHIYNRGNGKMKIFRDKEDYYLFLGLLEENVLEKKDYFSFKINYRPLESSHLRGKQYIRKVLPADSFEIICYCLMPNHFHIAIRQVGELEISKLVSKVCTSYSKRFNKKYNHIGHVFQDQFKAVLIDNNEQLLHLSAYIHSNPQVAGLVKNLEDWQFSSYLNFIGKEDYKLCNNKNIILDQFREIGTYKNIVRDSVEQIKSMKNLEYTLLDAEKMPI